MTSTPLSSARSSSLPPLRARSSEEVAAAAAQAAIGPVPVSSLWKNPRPVKGIARVELGGTSAARSSDYLFRSFGTSQDNSNFSFPPTGSSGPSSRQRALLAGREAEAPGYPSPRSRAAATGPLLRAPPSSSQRRSSSSNNNNNNSNSNGNSNSSGNNGSAEASAKKVSSTAAANAAAAAAAAAQQRGYQPPRPPAPLPTKPKKKGSHLRVLKALYCGPEDDGKSEISHATRAMDEALDLAHGRISSSELVARRATEEMQRIETGEDAIKFFSRYGGDSMSGADVTVLYFNRASEGQGSDQSTGPYDLVLVPKEQAKSEHFAISAHGVVHLQPGSASEFMSLSEWLHQSLMYRVLRSMSLFRLHPKRTCFEDWRLNSRENSFRRRRALLARTSFWAKPTFLKRLMVIKAAATDISDISLVKFPEEPYPLTAFQDLQHQHLFDPALGAGRRLEGYQDLVRSELESLFETVARLAEGSRTEAARQPTLSARDKSIVQEKREAEERAARARRLSEDQLRLGQCLHLTSMMLQSSLVSACQKAAKLLAGRLVVSSAAVGGGRGDTPAKKLIHVNAKLRGGAVELDPPISEHTEMLHQLSQELLQCCQALAPLPKTSPKLLAVDLGQSELASVEAILKKDTSWKEDWAAARGALDKHLLEAAAYAKTEFTAIAAEVVSFDQTWDRPDTSRSSSKSSTMPSTTSLTDFLRDIERIQRLQNELNKCRAQKQFGPVWFDARGLLASLLEVPTAALPKASAALAGLARTRCEELSRRIDQALEGLNGKPEGSSSEYRAYQRLYEGLFHSQSTFEKAADEIRQCHDTLQRLGFRMALEQRVEFEDMMKKEYQLVHSALLEARLWLDCNVPLEASFSMRLEAPIEDATHRLTVSLQDGSPRPSGQKEEPDTDIETSKRFSNSKSLSKDEAPPNDDDIQSRISSKEALDGGLSFVLSQSGQTFDQQLPTEGSMALSQSAATLALTAFDGDLDIS